MHELVARARVVLRAAPTYLVALSTIVSIVAEEVAAVLPAGPATTVGVIAVRVVAVLAAAVAIIRRVTPVVDSQHGLLPAPPAAPTLTPPPPTSTGNTTAWVDWN